MGGRSLFFGTFSRRRTNRLHECLDSIQDHGPFCVGAIVQLPNHFLLLTKAP